MFSVAYETYEINFFQFIINSLSYHNILLGRVVGFMEKWENGQNSTLKVDFYDKTGGNPTRFIRHRRYAAPVIGFNL